MSDVVLRHYQKGCAPAVIKYIKANKDKHPLVGMPTGSGKTYCIADLIKQLREMWKVDVLVLSHVKEILEQNHASLTEYLKQPIGLNSAGLGRRERKQITVAGIQSIYRQSRNYQKGVIVIIDEAHLISPKEDTMYQKFFAGLGKHICIGFTATPFRLGDGYIYGRNKLFNDLVYDWTTREKFQQLVDEGFLSTLTTKRTELEMDTSGINLKGGDFNESQLSERFNRSAVTQEAIKEILAAGRTRKKWLVFAIDIAHAEQIAETLLRAGIRTAPVHSRMADSGFDRTTIVEGFKNGKYQCVVNVNILTTGFDEPGIDLIAMLRPTKSPVLHVQSLGRGSRIQEGKANCLVLDFAGNTARLGPINDVLVLEKGKSTGTGEPITKDCPECASIVAPAVRICPDCGYKFLFEHGLSTNAQRVDIISSGNAAWLKVDKVEYGLHSNYGSPSSVKVTYHAEGYKINEYVCIEHKGFARHKAQHWIKYRGGLPCNSASDLLIQATSLTTPNKIMVQRNKKLLTLKDSSF